MHVRDPPFQTYHVHFTQVAVLLQNAVTRSDSTEAVYKLLLDLLAQEKTQRMVNELAFRTVHAVLDDPAIKKHASEWVTEVLRDKSLQDNGADVVWGTVVTALTPSFLRSRGTSNRSSKQDKTDETETEILSSLQLETSVSVLPGDLQLPVADEASDFSDLASHTPEVEPTFASPAATAPSARASSTPTATSESIVSDVSDSASSTSIPSSSFSVSLSSPDSSAHTLPTTIDTTQVLHTSDTIAATFDSADSTADANTEATSVPLANIDFKTSSEDMSSKEGIQSRTLSQSPPEEPEAIEAVVSEPVIAADIRIQEDSIDIQTSSKGDKAVVPSEAETTNLLESEPQTASIFDGSLPSAAGTTPNQISSPSNRKSSSSATFPEINKRLSAVETSTLEGEQNEPAGDPAAEWAQSLEEHLEEIKRHGQELMKPMQELVSTKFRAYRSYWEDYRNEQMKTRSVNRVVEESPQQEPKVAETEAELVVKARTPLYYYVQMPPLPTPPSSAPAPPAPVSVPDFVEVIAEESETVSLAVPDVPKEAATTIDAKCFTDADSSDFPPSPPTAVDSYSSLISDDIASPKFPQVDELPNERD